MSEFAGIFVVLANVFDLIRKKVVTFVYFWWLCLSGLIEFLVADTITLEKTFSLNHENAVL